VDRVVSTHNSEPPRASRDRIRASQLRWLEAAMGTGLSADSFLIVEWSFGRGVGSIDGFSDTNGIREARGDGYW
jgi:hypothetical protein